MKDDFNNTREREENRKLARDVVTKNLYEHEQKKGNHPTYREIEKQVYERADYTDRSNQK
jgi:hypothetical protein